LYQFKGWFLGKKVWIIIFIKGRVRITSAPLKSKEGVQLLNVRYITWV